MKLLFSSCAMLYIFLILCQAVTKAKLGYDPLEVNPEDMVCFAKEKPQVWVTGNVVPDVAKLTWHGVPVIELEHVIW